jgi:hypothetical protein
MFIYLAFFTTWNTPKILRKLVNEGKCFIEVLCAPNIKVEHKCYFSAPRSEDWRF